MSADVKNRTRLAVGASAGFAVALVLALTLLLASKFTGAEFTAFVLAFAVLAVAIGFAPEVQEISIVGNVVKLKEVKAEAIKAIESLNKSRVEMLRVFLGLALKHGGGFAPESAVDPRVPPFWNLVRLAKEYDCLKDLKVELINSVDLLLWAQQYNISCRNRDERLTSYGTYLEPLELAPIAFDEAGIILAESSRSPAPDNYRGEIKEALTEYSKLFEFKRVLESSQ